MTVPPLLERSRTGQLAEATLSIELPRHQYRPVKICPVPFDPRISSGGKFQNFMEAMDFIARHCQFHHRQFNRNLARLYLPFCRVLDLAKGGYFPAVHLSKREFDAMFNAAAKLIQGH
jgi:hypothetical protein